MSIYKNGSKVSSLFFTGSDINKAYHNGVLVFQKDQGTGFVTLNLSDGSNYEVRTLDDYAKINADPTYQQNDSPYNWGYALSRRTILASEIVGYTVHEREDFPDYLHLFLSTTPNGHMRERLNPNFKNSNLVVPANVRKFGMYVDTYSDPNLPNIEIDARYVTEIVNGIFGSSSGSLYPLGHMILPSGLLPSTFYYDLPTTRFTYAQGVVANPYHASIVSVAVGDVATSVTVDSLTPEVTGTAYLDFVQADETIINIPSMDIISLSHCIEEEGVVVKAVEARLKGTPLSITANSLHVESIRLAQGDFNLYVNSITLATSRSDASGHTFPAFSFGSRDFINTFDGGYARGSARMNEDPFSYSVAVMDAEESFTNTVRTYIDPVELIEPPSMGKINLVHTNQVGYDALYPLTDKTPWTTTIHAENLFVQGNLCSMFCDASERNSAFYDVNLVEPPVQSYGTLTYTDGTTQHDQLITTSSDYNLLFGTSASRAFSFATVDSSNILGWTFNTDAATSLVPSTIGDGMLRNLNNFNSTIIIPDWVTSIGKAFLKFNPKFNSPVTFGAAVATLGSGFLGSSGTSIFNSAITFNNTVPMTIGNDFISCIDGAFNQPLVLNNVVSIGSSFLWVQDNFNQSIIIPDNCTCVELFNGNIIGSSDFEFDDFNSKVTLSAGSKITDAILVHMNNTKASIEIECNTDPVNIANNQESFTFNNNVLGNHMTVTGTYADALLAKFPNGSINGYYRNLVKG